MAISVRNFAIWFFILCALAGCTSMPAKQKIPVAGTEHTIYFIYREWHTSILIDATTVARHSRYLQQEAANQRYIRIGWGDGNYFTGKSKTFGSATKALIASSHSALQVIAYAQPPFASIPPETRVPIAITDKGVRKLIRSLDKSFALDESGLVIPLQAYVTDAGNFYQASGHYSLFSNCNTWSGRALQAAGLPVRSGLQLTAQSIFEQARAISEYQQTLGLVGKSE
ncbi:DUF2459 domain-containing protein [Cellvibrio fibrivorans]|uniref:Uncharacterized protein (TIGR02117 family) n=1 Tax=Cellvibrio fibrivorans TaxID=126350 RepID=A0ABU1USL4_9GAMM|nr:DUF2459 domain-containing protein [Cellvibrio fibrivorans]MDR7088167.1 uncharacterized protein (TIGR02117 family) [Cellvibrio fibrivorans]